MLENRGLSKDDDNSGKNEQDENCDKEQKNEDVEFKVRLNIGRDLQIKMKEHDSIENLKKYISSQLNDLDPTKIRIIAKGKMLSNSYKICEPFRIKNGDIIHASFPASLYKEIDVK